MPSLRLVPGDGPAQSYPLDRDMTILGRDAACEIVLPHEEVSKKHARICRQGDGYYIEDLQSTNGTKVGDEELTGARRLQDGDRIEIVDFRLVFSAGEPAILSALDASSTPDRQLAQVRSEEKLCAVLAIARALLGTTDLDGVLETILEALFRVFPLAERGFVLLRDEAPDEPVLRASKVRPPGAGLPLFSRTVFHHVLSEGQALLCEDVAGHAQFGQSASVRASQIRTLLCVPLWDRERRPVGLLQIDTRDERGRFGQADLDLLTAVAGPLSMAVENARLHERALKAAEMEREAQHARAVQLALIPEHKPNLPGYVFWHHYEPARFVGGDYYDYRPVAKAGSPPGYPPARWVVALGDVAGKGMPAALIMARLSSAVGLRLQAEPDLARVVGQLNEDCCATCPEGRFITFLLALVDGERHEVTAVNAGHLGLLMRRADGRVEVFGQEQAGVPLGITAGESYVPVQTPLDQGDVVVLYTDGINEAMDGDGRQFGVRRLQEVLASAPGGAPAIGEALLAAVRRHAAGEPPSDDMTLLCFGRA
jgi:serine phosphatase RsbU (regulator of sigma subunit)